MEAETPYRVIDLVNCVYSEGFRHSPEEVKGFLGYHYHSLKAYLKELYRLGVPGIPRNMTISKDFKQLKFLDPLDMNVKSIPLTRNEDTAKSFDKFFELGTNTQRMRALGKKLNVKEIEFLAGLQDNSVIFCRNECASKTKSRFSRLMSEDQFSIAKDLERASVFASFRATPTKDDDKPYLIDFKYNMYYFDFNITNFEKMITMLEYFLWYYEVEGLTWFSFVTETYDRNIVGYKYSDTVKLISFDKITSSPINDREVHVSRVRKCLDEIFENLMVFYSNSEFKSEYSKLKKMFEDIKHSRSEFMDIIESNLLKLPTNIYLQIAPQGFLEKMEGKTSEKKIVTIYLGPEQDKPETMVLKIDNSREAVLIHDKEGVYSFGHHDHGDGFTSYYVNIDKMNFGKMSDVYQLKYGQKISNHVFTIKNKPKRYTVSYSINIEGETTRMPISQTNIDAIKNLFEQDCPLKNYHLSE